MKRGEVNSHSAVGGKLTETTYMKKILIIIFTISIFVSCETTGQKAEKKQDKIQLEKSDKKLKDSFLLKETFNQIDNPTNEFLSEKLKPIRENFKRINSISKANWSSIVTQDLEGTNEGGEVTYYHWNNLLDKIVTKEYGETFQVLTEYYLLKGKLSFVYQKALKYNRPIYHDFIAMKELNDNDTFNIDKSDIEETRNYFENGKLINQISNQDCGSPFSEEYLLKQQKEFIYNFNRVLKQENKK